MQCYHRAVLLSTIAACCCLLINVLHADESGTPGAVVWGSPSKPSPNNVSREPRLLQTHPVPTEANRERTLTLPENISTQQAPVTTANYLQPQQPTSTAEPAAQPATHTEQTRTPLPKPMAGAKKAKTASSSSGWKSLVSAASGLIFVIAIFVGFAFLTRRAWQPSSGSLPKQVFEVLGRSSYAPRQQVVLMRFGNKVLLVNHEQGNVQTLSEIEAEEEVQRIVAACEQNSSSSLSANFGNVLSQVIHGKGERSQNPRSFFSKAAPSPQARRTV